MSYLFTIEKTVRVCSRTVLLPGLAAHENTKIQPGDSVLLVCTDGSGIIVEVEGIEIGLRKKSANGMSDPIPILIRTPVNKSLCLVGARVRKVKI